MPKIGVNRQPAHRRHRASGLGYVQVAGRQHYTGPWGTPAAAEAYRRLVAEWLAGTLRPRRDDPSGPSVAEVADRYAAHVRSYYVRAGCDGSPAFTSFGKLALRVLQDLCSLYGSTPAARFTTAEYQAMRRHWVATPGRHGKPYARTTVNQHADIVRFLFRWAATAGLVPSSVYHDLMAVPRLHRGRSGAREPAPVGPAPLDAVAAVRAAVRPPVAALIDLQLLTGMRPGEACGLRPEDVDRSGPVWVYRVPAWVNKTEHLGRSRTVALGPRARALLAPWLGRCRRPDAWPFLTRRGNPFRPPAYATVIAQVCRRLGVASWTPNMLRHSYLTNVRQQYGLETASLMAGHADVRVTQVYAERDRARMIAVAEEIG